MSIEYTFTVVAVDAQARCMEIEYVAEGHQTMRIGARLPFVGESLEAVVAAYAPVALWEQLAAPVVAPEVGVTGVVTPAEPAPQPAPAPTVTFEVAEVQV